MNFLSKNLGWILLFAFFIFMLFVISTSDTKKGATPNTNKSEQLDQPLDTLIEKIEQDDQVQQEGKAEYVSMYKGEEESSDGEALTQQDGEKQDLEGETSETSISSEEEKEQKLDDKSEEGAMHDMKKPGFLSRFFGGSKTHKLVGGEKEDSQTEMEEDVALESSDSDSTQDTEQSSQGLISQTTSQSFIVEKSSTASGDISGSLYASSASSAEVDITTEMKTYASEVFADKNSDMETYVGKEYGLGVYSLKLNNAYFNTTLAYMLQGDRVKQLTSENIHGCFKVEIVHSQTAKNIGRQGYVCKKYLAEVGDTQVIEDIIPVTEEKTQEEQSYDFPESVIGTLVQVQKNTMLDALYPLTSGDILDQMTQLDSRGCFTAYTFSTQDAYSRDRVGNICYSDIH